MDERSMLRLSEVLRRDVERNDGTTVGRLVDLTIRHHRQPLVRRLVVRNARGRRLLVEASLVERLDPHVVLRLDAMEGAGPRGVVECDAGAPLPLDDGELCLGRDVLDTQIVDTTGRRVGRVGDVLLELDDDRRLEVVAADVGFGAVVRRMGLGRLSRRFPEDAVAWADLHLTSARGHVVQLATPDALVHRLSPDDLAHLLSRLSASSAHEVLRAAPADRVAAALHAAPTDVGGRWLTMLPDDEVADLLDALPTYRAEAYEELLRKTALPRRRFHRLRGWRRSHSSTAAPAR